MALYNSRNMHNERVEIVSCHENYQFRTVLTWAFGCFLLSFQSNPYGLKESGPTGDMSAWTSAGLQPTTGYYPYDPTLAAYG